MIFEPELETMPRPQLEEVQLRRLRTLVDVDSMDGLSELPFTRKDALRDAYPLGLFRVPRTELRRLSASSGTTGKPTVVAYTANDLDVFARVIARVLAAAGAEPGMTLHIAYGYGLFTGGLGFHDGAEHLGLTVVPVSGGMTERQMTPDPRTFGPTSSHARRATRSRSRRRSRSAASGPARSASRYALLGAEPWTEAMRGEIDARARRARRELLRALRDHRPRRRRRVRRRSGPGCT